MNLQNKYYKLIYHYVCSRSLCVHKNYYVYLFIIFLRYIYTRGLIVPRNRPSSPQETRTAYFRSVLRP